MGIILGIMVWCFVSSLSAMAADLKIWCVWAAGSAGTGTLIQGPNGTVVLFDEGGGENWAISCKALMDDVGISNIDYAIAGHYDTDHIAGLDDLNDLMGGNSATGTAPGFGVFMDRGGVERDDGSAIASDYYDFVTQSGKRTTVSVDGSSDIDLGSGAVIRFLCAGAPNLDQELFIRGRASVTAGLSENNKSIAVLLTYQGFDMYLGSDLEGTGEMAVDDVIVSDLDRHVDVMLVDHHGADTYDISSTEFLQNLYPEVAIFSVWNNTHGHPRYNTVTRLQAVVEADDQRIIRLEPGDTDDPDWAPENMSHCITTSRHVYIHTNGSVYTVDTVDRSGGNDITDADLINHSTDDSSPGHIVINQVCPFASPGEYIELFNTGASAVNLAGYTLNVYSGDYTFTSQDVIPAGGFFLVSEINPVAGVIPDVVKNIGITDNGTNSFAQLLSPASDVLDTVGWASASLYEGVRLGTLAAGKAWIRDIDGVDTGSNAADFSAVNPSPRNTGGAATPTPVPPTNTPTFTPAITPTPVPAGNVVINQVCPFASPGEYVELYNNGGSPVSLAGWTLNVYSGDYTFTASDVIPAYGYYLVSDTDPVSGIDPDVTTNIGITDNGANSFVQLLNSQSSAVDTVGWATTSYYEGTRLGTLPSGKVWIRDLDGVDTNNNAADFSAYDPNPRNSSGGAVPTATPVPPTNTPVPQWTELTCDDFEAGWGNFRDGGTDCVRYTGGARAYQGVAAANIQDNSGLGSSFYLNSAIDVDSPGYNQIKVEFTYYAYSMDNSNEDFWVQYYDGSEYITVASYAQGIDFENGGFYATSVTIDESGYTFPSNMKIRFMCDASADNDDVYIDTIRISAR